ncbi:restriction endonuclease subunit S [uncultured Dialister sp.]|uniref:restriction endonuclease subunit S n=1 Tax=uncultured Dialister sp. TaxID=278064 RepID=UPI0026255E90|nr:restriction endonuclease subunit S [uncultured Dialister sp.]
MKSKKKVLTPEEKLTQALLPKEEWPYELPKGWVWTEVEPFVQVIRGVTYKKNDVQNISAIDNALILRGGNIEEGTVNLKTNDNVFVDKRLISETQYIKENDVVIVASTGSKSVIGKAGIVHKECPNVAIGAFLLLIRPLKNVNSRFVDYYFETALYRNNIRKLANGVNINNVKQNYIKNSPFPLPPLPEQQRIVNKIESLFAKLDEARDRLQKVLEGYEARRAAILHEAFSGKWTGDSAPGEMGVPKGWRPTPAKDLFQYVTSGSRGWAKYYSSKGALFIRMGNLKHGTIEPDFTDVQYVDLPDKAEGQRSLVQDHDILISITADVGMIGYIDHISQEAYINQHIALARPVNPEEGRFLAWYLTSDKGLRQLQKKERGATKVGLSLGDIRNLTIFMPSNDKQVKIVNHIESLMEEEKIIHDGVQKALSQIDLMKKSILARAFRGELGTQDPSDPPAMDLLKERVMASEEVSKS